MQMLHRHRAKILQKREANRRKIVSLTVGALEEHEILKREKTQKR